MIFACALLAGAVTGGWLVPQAARDCGPAPPAADRLMWSYRAYKVGSVAGWLRPRLWVGGFLVGGFWVR